MIKQQFIEKNRPRRAITKLEGIVIHWTANTSRGADAQAHYRYFNNNTVNASAHYFVDDKEIVQLIPDNEQAWHVGDKIKKSNLPIRTSIVKNRNPNHLFIGVEICVATNLNQELVMENTIALVKQLLKKHKLTYKQIFRHYDITGKDCPKMFLPEVVSKFELEHAWHTFLLHFKTESTNPIVNFLLKW